MTGLKSAKVQSNNIYITGTFRASADFDPGPGIYNLTATDNSEVFVAKYTSAGTIVWAKAFGPLPWGLISSDGIAVAGDGAVYVTGGFYGTADFDPGPDVFSLNGNSSCFVSKLDTAGNFVWAECLGETDVYKSDIAVSIDGSVCTITSSSQGINVSKLDSAGDVIWTTRLGITSNPNGPVARDIALAADGSVYFTGEFMGTVNFAPAPDTCLLTSASADGYSAFICKLDDTGSFGWAESLSGSNVDRGNGIAVGPDGSVCTTGYFYGTVDFDPGPDTFDLTSSDWDVFVSKLDSVGNFVWAKQLGGTYANEGCIAVGGDGSIYTAGQSWSTADFDPGPDVFNLTNAGMFVCKLDSAGAFVWARGVGGEYWDCPSGIALGTDGSAYMAGSFPGTGDFDPSIGTFNLTDHGAGDAFVVKLLPLFVPTDLMLSSNNIAEGQSAGTEIGSFSTDDVQLGTAFTYTLVSGDGSDSNDSFTIVGDQLQSSVTFNAAAKDSYNVRVRTTDTEGFFFERAFTITVATVDTARTLSVDGVAWNDLNHDGIRESGEPGIGGNVVRLFWTPDQTVGNTDDLLLGSATTDTDGRYSFADLLGGVNYYLTFEPLPGRTFTTQGAGSNSSLDSDSDASGTTALIAAPVEQASIRCDAGFVSVPRVGFVRDIGGSSYGNVSHGESVVTDAWGNVYVTGYFQGRAANLYLTSVGNSDIFVAKYSPSRAFLWAKGMGGTGFDWSLGVAVGTDGNVYLTGSFVGTVDFDPGPDVYSITSVGENDVFVVKLDTWGNFVWARSMGGSGDDYAYGIALAPDGSVCTTGFFQGTADFDPGTEVFDLTGYPGYNIFVSKLDSAGQFVWAKCMAGTDWSQAYSIAVGTDGSVFTTGCFSGTTDFDPGPGTFNLTCTGYYAAFVCKLDAGGNFVWANSISETIDERMYGIALGADGSVYTTGHSWLTDDSSVGTTGTGGTIGWVDSMNLAGEDESLVADNADTNAGSKEWLGPGSDDTLAFASTLDQDTLTAASLATPGTFGLNGMSSVIVCKLDAAGHFVWIKSMGDAGHSEGVGIAVGADENIYTTGRFEGRVDFDPGTGVFNLDGYSDYTAFVSVLDPDGDFVWAYSIDRSWEYAGTSVGLGIAATADKSIYATGYFGGMADFAPGPDVYNLTSWGYRDIFVLKLQTLSVTISRAVGQSDLAIASPMHFTVVFNEVVSDFTADDVTLSGTAFGKQVTKITGSGVTYDVEVNAAGSGTIIATIDAGVAHDATGQPNIAATSVDNIVTYKSQGLAVTSPNGSEIWQRGTTHDITWWSSGSPGSLVQIDLYKGGVFNRTITYGTPDDGSYTWSTPANWTAGGDYRVKISSRYDPSFRDYSDGDFMISAGCATAFVGVFADGIWYRDANGNRVWDDADAAAKTWYGWQGSTPVVGDWNGDGKTEVGVFAADATGQGWWYRDVNGNGYWDATDAAAKVPFGWQGSTPVVGDWNGDGKTEIGVFAADASGQGWWYRDVNGNGYWDATDTAAKVPFGWQGSTPAVGDWNGDGKSEVGVFAADATGQGWWYRDVNGNGYWDRTDAAAKIGYGWQGSTPVAGDLNGDGRAEVGVFAADATGQSWWYRDVNGNGYWDGTDAAAKVAYGWQGSTPVVGRWNGGSALQATDRWLPLRQAFPRSRKASCSRLSDEAIARWANAGLDAATIERLTRGRVCHHDLPGAFWERPKRTGSTSTAMRPATAGSSISTPARDDEFVSSRQRQAIAGR